MRVEATVNVMSMSLCASSPGWEGVRDAVDASDPDQELLMKQLNEIAQSEVYEDFSASWMACDV